MKGDIKLKAYRDKLKEYLKLKSAIETLNNDGVEEFKNGNVALGESTFLKRNKLIEQIKSYNEYTITTGNLRAIINELLLDESLTCKELDLKLGFDIGTIESLLISNKAIKLKEFEGIFKYFEIPEILNIKEKFKNYIVN